MDIITRDYLFENGWCISLSNQDSSFEVYLDPRSKLKVGKKKVKVSKLKVGDVIEDLTIDSIKSPLIKSHILGIKKLKEVCLINLRRLSEFVTKPSYFTEADLYNFLVDTGFTFGKRTFDGIELLTDDGQRLFLPYSIVNLKTGTVLYNSNKDVEKRKLEIY